MRRSIGGAGHLAETRSGGRLSGCWSGLLVAYTLLLGQLALGSFGLSCDRGPDRPAAQTLTEALWSISRTPVACPAPL
jgi:hypothetical protein